MQRLTGECANNYAAEKHDDGAALLVELLSQIPQDPNDHVAAKILAEAAKSLREPAGGRFEYLLLALHTLQMAATERGRV